MVGIDVIVHCVSICNKKKGMSRQQAVQNLLEDLVAVLDERWDEVL